MMLRRLFNAPWPDPSDMPASVREQASKRIHAYWRARGWHLVLGEFLLLVAAYQQEDQYGAYAFLVGIIGIAYLLGLFPRIKTFWLVVMVGLLMIQGMLVGGLGAVTAVSYMLPYTFAAMLLHKRQRIFVQAWCVVCFWSSLLYEVLPTFPQVEPVRSILVSYNILLAAFTFQGLRFLNNLAVELNTAYVAAEVRGQSQQFLARVSHELRTPLNSILGFAKMLNRTELDEKQAGYLTQIIDEGEQLNRLVSDLLDSAHLSTGKLTLSKAPCQVNTICETVAEEQRQHLKPDVEMRLNLKQDLPEITADKTRLRQVVGNLVANAIKHTDKGEISITTTRRGSSILIAVRDTGSGIPENQQELVFVPFVQLDGQKVGVGLGLDIALQLARLHGGDIHLQSTVGQGSTFTIELPITSTN